MCDSSCEAGTATAPGVCEKCWCKPCACMEPVQALTVEDRLAALEWAVSDLRCKLQAAERQLAAQAERIETARQFQHAHVYKAGGSNGTD